MDTCDEGPSSSFALPNVATFDMLLFMAVTVQMGCDITDHLDYLATSEQLCMLFYNNATCET